MKEDAMHKKYIYTQIHRCGIDPFCIAVSKRRLGE